MVDIENTKESPAPESTLGIKFRFILFGVGSLLAWNAIMTELDFFNEFLPKLYPFKTISFLNFAPNIILQFILLWKKNLFKIEKQLIFALITSIIFLILIPGLTIALQNNQTANIAISVILFLLMGLINALLSSGFFAFASFFPLEMIISLSTGQGFAGIILNIIKYIIIPTVNNEEPHKKKGETIRGIIFFCCSILILLACLICLIISLKNEYFKYYLNQKDRKSKLEEEERLYETQEELERITNYNIDLPQISFIGMFKLLYDIDLLCVLIYVVTFCLYPISIQNQTLFEIDKSYNLNTLLTIYNFFDTIGRYLVSAVTPTKKKAYISSLIRIIFIATFILNYYFEHYEYNKIFTSILLILNVSLFALTNGIGTTLCFGIAPTLVTDDLKGQAGASVSFFTIVGIFAGSCFAFLTDFILDKIYHITY